MRSEFDDTLMNELGEEEVMNEGTEEESEGLGLGDEEEDDDDDPVETMDE